MLSRALILLGNLLSVTLVRAMRLRILWMVVWAVTYILCRRIVPFEHAALLGGLLCMVVRGLLKVWTILVIATLVGGCDNWNLFLVLCRSAMTFVR